MNNKSICYLFCLLAIGACLMVKSAEAGQGCPFEDGSCQEYCGQQGCNLGYCGHFAWIQCICRKCGDEWNWYDKVHYNPDKQVNQTELDSLKLNVSAPIILTNNKEQRSLQPSPAPTSTGQQQNQAQVQVQVQASKQVEQVAAIVPQQQQQQQQQQPQQKPATLTTLLIPDLSDGSKLDLNDIPDENSEKFLDYLAKNHEKLVQATSQSASKQQSSNDDEEDADQQQQATTTTATPTGSADEPLAEETVEIQISSSNNQQPAASATNRQSSASTDDKQDTDNNDDDNGAEESQEKQQQQQQRQVPVERHQSVVGGTGSGQMTRLLRMAVAERLTDNIYY